MARPSNDDTLCLTVVKSGHERKEKKENISSLAFTLYFFMHGPGQVSTLIPFSFWVLSGPCIRNKKSVTLSFSSSSSFLWAETSGALRAVRPRKEKKKGKGNEGNYFLIQRKATENKEKWFAFLSENNTLRVPSFSRTSPPNKEAVISIHLLWRESLKIKYLTLAASRA